MSFKRIYHPLELWEEIPANMWGKVKDRKRELARAKLFTGNHRLYGSYMMKVVKGWRFSCENALTDSSLNQKAWIGHAATAMALGMPEDITRQAWGLITEDERTKANVAAKRAIEWWGKRHKKGGAIPELMGVKMLP